MNLETFFHKFDQFADAPGAVAKMRELVLDLASQGKLVKQKSDEGDGHDLLRQIYKKNPPLVTDKEEEPVVSELASFPKSWAQSKLGEVAEIIRGVTFPGSAKSGTRTADQVACLRTASVQTEIDWEDLIFISPTHVGRSDQWVAPNDIIISMANSFALVGKVAIVRQVPQKATFGGFLAAIRPILIEPYFLLYVLRSPRMQGAFRASSSQTTNIANISLGRMRPLPFPLPPLAEQKRIVAKVNELMALCDQLEAQQQERESRHRGIARASLSRFAEAPTPANLNFLFHKSYTIQPADLRKSILTLAVQGKLVPQDPNDESTENLIERVKSILPQKKNENPFLGSIEASITNESEYELPQGWAWLPLGHVGIWATGCGFPTQYQGEAAREFMFCKVSDMNLPGNEVEIRTTVHSIDADVMKKIRARANPVGTVIFPKIGGAIATHKRRLVIRPTIIDNNCSGIQPIGLTDDRWLLLFMRNLDLTKYQSGTSVPAVSQGSLDPIRIGLPPLSEQRRIVAKVDQVMALVDALDCQLTASRATAANLLSAIVAELTGTTSSHPVSAQPESGPARRGRPRKSP